MCLLGALSAVSCECGKRSSDDKTLALKLNWFAEAEHGGYFAADVHGLYRKAGVDVRIIAGRPDGPLFTEVGTGRVELGVGDASEVLIARASGVPVVAIFAPLQTNPRCIMVREDGPARLQDLRNLTLAMNVREAFAQLMKARLPLEGVRIVPYVGSVAPFLAEPRYAQQAYVFSEPFVARQRGVEVRCLMVSELDFNPYASLLVTSEATLREKRPRLRAVVRASAAGWRRFLAEPGPSKRRIRELNPEMTEAILQFGVAAVAPLVQVPGTNTGEMTRARWQALRTSMVEAGVIDERSPGVDGAFEWLGDPAAR